VDEDTVLLLIDDVGQRHGLSLRRFFRKKSEMHAAFNITTRL
jgi:hypothetical protein